MTFRKIKKIILLSSVINRPFFFNFLRYLVTGNQKKLKLFVSENVKKYHCKKVLDVCCGTGDFVQNSGVDYIGIDINRNFIAYAQKKHRNKHIKFMAGNALSLPFPDGYFDGALMISTLHHFSDAELVKLLKEVKRVTKKIAIFADLVYRPANPIKRLFVLLDQGDYVRPEKQKEKLISRYFHILSSFPINVGLAEQYCMVAEKSKS